MLISASWIWILNVRFARGIAPLTHIKSKLVSFVHIQCHCGSDNMLFKVFLILNIFAVTQTHAAIKCRSGSDGNSQQDCPDGVNHCLKTTTGEEKYFTTYQKDSVGLHVRIFRWNRRICMRFAGPKLYGCDGLQHHFSDHFMCLWGQHVCLFQFRASDLFNYANYYWSYDNHKMLFWSFGPSSWDRVLCWNNSVHYFDYKFA